MRPCPADRDAPGHRPGDGDEGLRLPAPFSASEDQTQRARWPDCCYLAVAMRIVVKLLMKFLMMVAMVLLMGSGLKHGTRFITGGSGGLLGAAGEQVTSEESDLMSTVLKSALRLLSGNASRSELADELSDQLYAQRGAAGDMSELGIDLVKAKKAPSTAGAEAKQADPQRDAKSPGKPGAPTVAQRGGPVPGKGGEGPAGEPPAGPELVSGKSQTALAELWKRMRPYTVEMGLVPVVFLGMFLVSRVRRRKREASFVPEFAAALPESDCETHEMKHPVGSLTDEEFELLAAMIYQRQGYRVSLPAGIGGGRNGDFKLARKSERLLVKCQKMGAEHRVPLERVRELHDAMTDASATGGLYVTSCGFTWDARHFAKTRRIKLISGKTLDALLTAAGTAPGEDLLAIPSWISKFMTKVELTTPHCPECEAEMEREKEGDGSGWLCSQRPECGGQRAERQYKKAPRTPSKDAGTEAAAGGGPPPAPERVVPARREPHLQLQSPPPPPREATTRETIEARGSRPPAVPGPQAPQLPATQPAAPEPAPGPARGADRRRNAATRSIRAIVPKRRGFVIVEKPPVAPRPAPGPLRSAGSIPPPAPKPQGAHLPVAPPTTPKPAPGPARGGAAGGSRDTGGTSPAAPKRRGFRLPENERATPKPASRPQ